jgi:hypothetical protein
VAKGYVYLLTNEAMPGYVKIGITERTVEERIEELSRATGVPMKFDCFFAVYVENAKSVETKILDGLNHVRLPNKEFFKIAPERVRSLMQLPEHEVYVPYGATDSSEEQVGDQSNLPRLNFKAAGLKVGDELVFSRDKIISVVIKSSDKVQFQNEDVSLAQATKSIFLSRGEKWSAGAASEYWKFNDDILSTLIMRVDPSKGVKGFALDEVFPIIARLIKEINEDTRQFASHAQIVDSLLRDSEPKTMLETARMLTRFSETQQIASNMVAWWSQQITVGFNPFKDDFERRQPSSYEYWAKSLGGAPL